MKIGLITRDAVNRQIIFVCSGWLTDFGKIDLQCALDSYGFLIKPNETISTPHFIRRIRATYAKSKRRDHFINTLIASAWPHSRKLPARHYRGKYPKTLSE